uniref:Uncharacterized protein n=1 Tax=Caenorhabditis tropicalis TaxID=1561998 RepID=A0A1I7V014_9PELO
MSSKTFFVFIIFFGLVSAGLSRKRRGTYEDEAITPAGGGASAAPMAAEEAAVTVAPEGAGAQSVVESSGYRKKRATQNSYGDEASAPVGGGAPVADVSEAPAVTVENVGGSQSAVASSGY